jgi:hypothetical protein
MDIRAATTELKKIAGSETTLEAGVHKAGLLRAEALYVGEAGAKLLAADIRASIERLGEDERSLAEALLTPEQPHTNWTHRIKSLASGNGGGRAKHAELILAFVGHELLELCNRSASSPLHQINDPLERVSYEMTLEVDNKDHRKHTLCRKIVSRVTVPAVRLVLLSHYYIAGAVKSKVEMGSEDHKYVGTIPDPLGSDNKWRSHVIDLGRNYATDDLVTIETREIYWDKSQRLHALYPVLGLHELINVYSPIMEYIEIGIRLPADLRANATATAHVAVPPLYHKIKTYRPSITDDGWASQRFDKLKIGYQCVVCFPGISLYD